MKTEFPAKLIKIGNSYGVTIPARYIKLGLINPQKLINVVVENADEGNLETEKYEMKGLKRYVYKQNMLITTVKGEQWLTTRLTSLKSPTSKNYGLNSLTGGDLLTSSAISAVLDLRMRQTSIAT